MSNPHKSKPPLFKSKDVPEEVARAYDERTQRKSTCQYIFEVDYSINSRKPRFFIYNVTDGSFYTYKCAHGGGGKNAEPHDGHCREVSNQAGSNCSALGVLETGPSYVGHVGHGVKLLGLSPTNSHDLSRGIVIHGAKYVYDNDANTDNEICGRSDGCIAVDVQYINREEGGELIDWLKNGSIGVAHYGGAFSI